MSSETLVDKVVAFGTKEIVSRMTDNASLALAGLRNVSTAAVTELAYVGVSTSCQGLKAAEAVGSELVSVSTNLAVRHIEGFQAVSAAVGNAVLASLRGSVCGLRSLGAECAEVGKTAAQQATQAGRSAGAATRNAAVDVIEGTGQVSALAVAVTRSTALDAIRGSGELALSLEEAVMITARAIVRDLREVHSGEPPFPRVRAEVASTE